MATFHKFAQLPAELQLRVWQTATAGSTMQVFDVCFPSWRGHERSRRAFAASTPSGGTMDAKDELRFSKYKDFVFLDVVDTSPGELDRPTSVARHHYDPSGYKMREKLRETCLDSSEMAALPSKDADLNTVYLPGPNRVVKYDNSTDVLHLRFRDSGAAAAVNQDAAMISLPTSGSIGADKPQITTVDAEGPSPPELIIQRPIPPPASGPNDTYDDEEAMLLQQTGISAVLQSMWSPEVTNTLQSARRIALDVAETWTDASSGALVVEEVFFLACTLQRDLEVLYLVDYCPGRCGRCGRRALRARDLQARGGELDADLHGDDAAELARAPDVVQGVGKTYREVFDLERLGWGGYHPTFIFAKIIDEAIRSQQLDGEGEPVFQGVRILVAEDDAIEGVDTSTLVECDHEAVQVMEDTTKAWATGALSEL